MKWFRSKQAMRPVPMRQFLRVDELPVISSLVELSETLTRRYSRETESAELVKRTLGIVDTAAMMNARACASVPLRLYRRGAQGRQVGKARVKSLASGHMGLKAANFVESGDFREVTDHPALNFARSPNPYFGEMFNVSAFYWREITGEFYSIVTDNELGKLQWPGYPQFTAPVFSKAGLFHGVYFGRDQSEVVEVPAEQVIYYRARMARHNPNRGEGVVASQLPDIDALLKTMIAAVAFLDNGQVPPGMISVTQDHVLTPEQMERMYDHLDEWRIGGRRQGKPFIGQNVSWVPINWNPKDLRTIEQTQESEKRIWQAFGIPDSIREGNASTYAGALVADAQYGKLTILPRLIVDADQKTNLILPMFGLDPEDWCFVYDNPVPKDEQAEWTAKGSATSLALMTINEAREEMGYDKAADPMANRLLFQGQPVGSRLGGLGLGLGLPTRQPQQAVPAATGRPEDAAEAGAASATVVQDTALNGAQIAQLVELARLVGIGEIGRQAAQAIAFAGFPGIAPDKIAAIFSELVEGDRPDPDPETPPPGGRPPAPEGDETKAVTPPLEPTMPAQESAAAVGPALVKDALAAEGCQWQNTCGCGKCSTVKAVDDEIPPGIVADLQAQFGPGFQASMNNILTEAQGEMLRAYWDGDLPNTQPLRVEAERLLFEEVQRIAADAIRSELTNANAVASMFDVVDERAIEYARTYSIRLADDVMGTTADIAKRAVERGLQEGLTIREVQDAMKGVPEYRAEMIARTELSRAANGARYEQFAELGAASVEWILAPGACPLCTAIAAKGPQPVGEPFARGGENLGGVTVKSPILAPPAHPNDRCVIVANYPEGDE